MWPLRWLWASTSLLWLPVRAWRCYFSGHRSSRRVPSFCKLCIDEFLSGASRASVILLFATYGRLYFISYINDFPVTLALPSRHTPCLCRYFFAAEGLYICLRSAVIPTFQKNRRFHQRCPSRCLLTLKIRIDLKLDSRTPCTECDKYSVLRGGSTSPALFSPACDEANVVGAKA